MCNDETECFGWCRRVFPGSLRAINLRTAFGLSVPKQKEELLFLHRQKLCIVDGAKPDIQNVQEACAKGHW